MTSHGWRRMPTMLLAILLALAGSPALASTIAIQDIVDLKGQGSDRLWGIGLVVGLPGTGDDASSLPTLRKLARVLEHGAAPAGGLAELADSRSVAIVMVSVELPKTGIKAGDEFDALVHTMHSAESLEGGSLVLTAMTGPLPGQGVYAQASGRITIDGLVPTAGRITRGVRMVEDIDKPVIDASGVVTLHIRPPYAGWTTSHYIAMLINSDHFAEDGAPEPAIAIDDRTVRVTLPRVGLRDPAVYIAGMLALSFEPSVLDLPARVVVNQDRGTFVVTGNVAISPAIVSHNRLVVRTVTPPIAPTPENPEIRESSLTAVTTQDPEAPAMVEVEALLDALNRLDVPSAERIGILRQLHRVGALHAELIVE